MKDTFEGVDGVRRLTEALLGQDVVCGDPELADAFCKVGSLRDLAVSEILIKENANEHDLYFILSGALSILVKGAEVGKQFPRTHVGDMSAIEPTQLRSATVMAAEPSTVLRITEPQLSEIADRFPKVWRQFAKELARRLLRRNDLIKAPRSRIRVFVISSVEALGVAYALQTKLQHDALIHVWTDGTFRTSEYPLESLDRELQDSDFAVAIASPDDSVIVRGARWPTARDNVTFELGLFIGRLGRERTMLLELSSEPIKLASDLKGLNTISYSWVSGADQDARFAPACNAVRNVINRLGIKKD